MKTVGTILSLLLMSAALPVAADMEFEAGWKNGAYHRIENKPPIGLALSGGGARGICQVGVLKAFEENEIHIGAIAGTSIGGIIGGLYASGYSPGELEKIIKNINFIDLFSTSPRRTSMFLTKRRQKEHALLSIRFDGFKPHIPQAITAGQKLSDLLSRLTLKANYRSNCSFTDMKIPFYVVTTDIVSGDKVVIDHGNLADAMRATMAFPLAFTGVESDDMILMDGGMVDPIPVDIIRERAGDIGLIVAVNSSSDLLTKDQISDPIDIAGQVTSIMTMDKLHESLTLADLVITPEIGQYNSTAFNHVDTLIELGYRAGSKAIGELRNLLRLHNADTFFIASVNRVDMISDHDSILFPIQPGQYVTRQEISESLDNYYRENRPFYMDVRALETGTLVGIYPTLELTLVIEPRPKLSDLQFSISGNSIFDNNEILALLANGDSLLSPEKLRDVSDSLMHRYESRGYDLAHIRRLDYDYKAARLEIGIDEGLIKEISIAGNEKTKTWLIKSNFTQKAGEPFNSKQAALGVANIYATDLFDRVTMNILPVDGGALVHLNVEEKKYSQLRIGWHWHDEYKGEQFIEFLNDNLLGTGQELLAHLQYGNHRQDYYFHLKADRFFSTYLTYRLSGFYGILERRIYDESGEYLSTFTENRFGGEFVLGRQISRFGTVTGELRFEEIEQDFADGVTDRIQLRSVTFRSMVETFDRYPLTNEGKKHQLYVTFAADILGGETRFNKAYSSIESYFPINRFLNFHPKIEIGHTNTKVGIPSSERFYIGGHHSMYGYRTDELVGAKMFLMNLELRVKLPFRFYLSGRYDTGDVYSTVDEIKLKNLRHAGGISLIFHSPIGPFDFGWGKSGSNPDRFYIDVGLKF